MLDFYVETGEKAGSIAMRKQKEETNEFGVLGVAFDIVLMTITWVITLVVIIVAFPLLWMIYKRMDEK